MALQNPFTEFQNSPANNLKQKKSTPSLGIPLSSEKKITTNNVIGNIRKIQPELKNLFDKIKTQIDAPASEVKIKRYSYDHLEIKNRHNSKNVQILEIIKSHQHNLEHIETWFSENANRFNSWKKKKAKIIVVTDKLFFIFNSNRSLKRVFQLKEIVQVSQNRQYNYISIKTKAGNDELLELINKEELLMYIEQQLKKQNKKLPLSDTKNLTYVSTVQQKIYFDPMNIKQYKPQWVKTFNYASKHNIIGYASIKVSQFLGLIDNTKSSVLLLTNIAIICFSVIEFNIVEILPLIGTKVYEDRIYDKQIRLILSDGSEKIIEYNSQLDKNLWHQAIKTSIQKIEE